MSVLQFRTPPGDAELRPGGGEDGGVSAADRGRLVEELRGRMDRLAGGIPRVRLATPPELSGLLDLRTGGAYQVDNAALVLSLLAGPSRAGAWIGVVGADDLGLEAAAEAGVDLRRIVVVPDPGEHWVEVAAALIDVAGLVVVRPPSRVDARTAGRLGARLRNRSAALISWGPWPGAEARLSLAASDWLGIEQGHGRLQGRRMTVTVRRGSAPPQYAKIGGPAPMPAPRRPRSDAVVAV